MSGTASVPPITTMTGDEEWIVRTNSGVRRAKSSQLLDPVEAERAAAEAAKTAAAASATQAASSAGAVATTLAYAQAVTLGDYALPAAGSVARPLVNKIREIAVSPEDFGAKNDSTTDDGPAIQAAINYVRSLPRGGEVRFLPGSGYRLATAIECYPSVNLSLVWEEGSRVLVDLTGAGTIAFKATNPTTPSARGKRLTLVNPLLDFHSNVPNNAVGAVFFEHRYASDLKIQGNRGQLVHYRNNTAVRLSALFNCDMEPLTIWGAGYNRAWKTTPALFSIASGSTTLTSDIDVFEAADIGKSLLVGDSSGGQMLTISAVTDARTATVDTAAVRAVSNQRGVFEPVWASVAAGSATLTLNKAVLTASDVGRVVYLIGGEPASWPTANTSARRVITAVVNANTATLDSPVPNAVTDEPLVISPVVEIYSEDATQPGVTNDFTWRGLHLEQFRGTGLVVRAASRAYLPEIKLHSFNGGWDHNVSTLRGLFDRCVADISGVFEGQTVNKRGSVLVSAQWSQLRFQGVQAIQVALQPFAYVMKGSAGSSVRLDGISYMQTLDVRTASRVLMGDGTSALMVSGPVNGADGSPARGPVFGGSPPMTPIRDAASKVTAVADAYGGAQFHAVGYTNLGAARFVGTVAGGTPQEPVAPPEYSTAVSLTGRAVRGDNTVQRVGEFIFRTRAPADDNVAGEAVLVVRGADGTDRSYVFTSSAFHGGTGDYSLGWSGGPWRWIYGQEIRLGDDSAPRIIPGTGSPEGVVWGTPGSLYIRKDGDAATTLYVKSGSAGYTGWTAK